MKIDLYHSSDPPEKCYKTLTQVQTLSGQLRHDSDSLGALDVDFDIESNQKVRMGEINYVRIAEISSDGTHTMERYFFISSWSETLNGIMTLHLHEDVMETFHTNITNATGLFVRSDNGNPYLDDGTFKTLGSVNVITQPFDKSFNQNPTYLLTVAGG